MNMTTAKLMEALEILKWMSDSKHPIFVKGDMNGRPITCIQAYNDSGYKFNFQVDGRNDEWRHIDFSTIDLRAFYYLKEKGELS